jgi:hypothetical protein
LAYPLANIIIKVIPHEEQRYSFYGGDYWEEDGGATLQIRVSDMGDWKLNSLVAEHELHEYLLCRSRGIPEWSITSFDMEFDTEVVMGLHGEDDEPGDDPRAPYFHEHQSASIVESVLRMGFGISPEEYDEAWLALFKEVYHQKEISGNL